MRRGGEILLIGASLLTSGCATSGNIQVRAIADPGAKLGLGGSLLADGRAQLALGNVGLALESFRKLLIQQPSSADAFAGIAQCYRAMGRYDLERQNYEFALAYSPHDPMLLSALARTLDELGQTAQAAGVRAEIARMAAAPAAQPTLTPIAVPHLGSLTTALPPIATAAVGQPKAAFNRAAPTMKASAPLAPAAVGTAKVQSNIPAPAMTAPAPVDFAAKQAKLPSAAPLTTVLPQLASAAVSQPQVTPNVPAPKTNALPSVDFAAVSRAYLPSSPSLPVALPPLASAALNQSEVRLNVPAPATRALAPVDFAAVEKTKLPSAASLMTELPQLASAATDEPKLPSNVPASATTKIGTPSATAATPPRPAQPTPAGYLLSAADSSQSESAVVRKPHLERLSSGEVALVTTTKPLWQAPALAELFGIAEAKRHAMRAATVVAQWVPLKSAEPRPVIQLLNAARSQGLAAATRVVLASRGWRKIGIGNATKIRQRSVVLYSASNEYNEYIARRLAARFHCRAVPAARRGTVVVLLGRDAALRRASSQRA